jgi:hypothetical protein
MTRIAYFGHHKSGSTFIKSILRAATREAGMRMQTEFLSTRLPLGYEKDPAQAARIAETYQRLGTDTAALLCHGNADRAVVETLASQGPLRGFHVIRDPRDLMVSGYFWHISDQWVDSNPWNVERRARLRTAPNQEAGLLQEVTLSACYFEAMAEWDYTRQDILEMRFETIIADPLPFLRDAFTFVGLPTGDLERIVAERAFQRLAGGRARGQEARDQKYRKGIAGDWRNHFTPRITDAFKQRHGRLLVQLGYEADLNW